MTGLFHMCDVALLVCVCEREREKERERKGEREREKESHLPIISLEMIQVFFAEYRLFYWSLLQKRPIIYIMRNVWRCVCVSM